MNKPLETQYQILGKRVYVAGHRGMMGSALLRRLAREQCDVVTATSEELDLRRQADTESWLAQMKPDIVILAAAKVGGIHANNTRPAEFLYDNLAIENNVIHASWRAGVEKLLFVASSCIYPRLSAQPMREEYLLTGLPEPTNEGYALAKIIGIKLCQYYRKQYGANFVSAIPPNLYGPKDNFDPLSSHVIPGLLLRTHNAKEARTAELPIWGTGSARREFMHVDDAADACLFLLKSYSSELAINVGCGHDISIADLARLICDVVGFEGGIAFDKTKPDGMPAKLMDNSRMDALGWKASISLDAGLRQTYSWLLENLNQDGTIKS